MLSWVLKAQLEATVEELRRQVENDAILERTMHQTLGQLSLAEAALDAINAYHLSIQEELALPVKSQATPRGTSGALYPSSEFLQLSWAEGPSSEARGSRWPWFAASCYFDAPARI